MTVQLIKLNCAVSFDSLCEAQERWEVDQNKLALPKDSIFFSCQVGTTGAHQGSFKFWHFNLYIGLLLKEFMNKM